MVRGSYYFCFVYYYLNVFFLSFFNVIFMHILACEQDFYYGSAK